MNTIDITNCLKKTVAISGMLALSGCAFFLNAPRNEVREEVVVTTEEYEAQYEFSREEQSPGFFRMRLGEYTITALYDGAVQINHHLMKGRPQWAIKRILTQARQPEEVSTAVNAFLIDDGNQIILVDTGASDTLGKNMGQLRSSMTLSGYSPEDIDVILLTHLHADHVGGLLEKGEIVFPRAHVYAPDKELSYWRASARLRSELPVFKGALAAINPYRNLGQFHSFKLGTPPIPGIESVPLPGHTPGHTGYRVKSGKDSLLIWGDVVQNHITQFTDPRISLEFDKDLSVARTTRVKLLRSVAQSGEWVAGTHLPFPGIGRVQAIGRTSYRWLPVDYSSAMFEVTQR